ncbi:MAG: M36 family metallopeptidase [Actinomycetota bacterium]
MRRYRSLAFGLSVTAVVTALASPAFAAPSETRPTQTTIPAGLEKIQTRTSLLGTHTWYRQTFRGLPVLDGYYAVHSDTEKGTRDIIDNRQKIPSSLNTDPDITADAAARAADNELDQAGRANVDKREGSLPQPDRQRATLAVRGGDNPSLVWDVVGTGDTGSVRTVVDAQSGDVLDQRSVNKHAEGVGRVFNPNPIVTKKSQNLTDQGDADQDAFTAAYRYVTLTDLDDDGRTLTGAYVDIRNDNRATASDRRYLYPRSDPRFEQVMAYRHLTYAQRYLRYRGFTDINSEPQDVYVNTIAADNSFYDAANDRITYGSGGVDDAEDAEILWHEYGHAILDDQVPGFGIDAFGDASGEAGAIGEGTSDYLAATLSVPVSAGYDVPCIGDWDATSYTDEPHCLRRIDTNKKVDDMNGDVHDDGQIWSRALWDIQQQLGRRVADTIILEAQFRYRPDSNFSNAGTQIALTGSRLFGGEVGRICQIAFEDRGIQLEDT